MFRSMLLSAIVPAAALIALLIGIIVLGGPATPTPLDLHEQTNI